MYPSPSLPVHVVLHPCFMPCPRNPQKRDARLITTFERFRTSGFPHLVGSIFGREPFRKMITALGFDVVMCDSDNVFVSDPFASGALTRTWILLLEFSLLSLRMYGEIGQPSGVL